MAPKEFYITLVIIAMVSVFVTAIKVGPREKKMPTTTVTDKYTNRLINESSPYLLQHAHNPVDWYPWGTDAFEKAKNENKPIFLSIGYSTCHWCHVMEKESFENEKIARIMNDYFVSIKVDREERPDIDQIYMNAVIATTGNGGWPLSVFLTPDGEVFYGGTYFPPKDSYGRVGFEHLLLRIAQAWKNKREDLVISAEKITEFLQSIDTGAEKSELSAETLKKAFLYFRNHFDEVNGGFGGAPKFPQPTNLSMLLCYWQKTADRQALDMVERTLDVMAKGGIYDHISGGFHRYSTDEGWLVPHFEKMLYNQALLSKVYLQGYQITRKYQYSRIVRETFDYVLRDMTDANGGFYSAEDADSEGKEGTFYLWTPEETASVLEQEQAKLFNAYYGVTERGNFEEGKTILNIKTSAERLGKEHQKSPGEIENILADARTKIFEECQKRSRPYKDDKIITAWNGLMISSLAFGGRVLQEDRYAEAAKRSAEFILSTLHKDGRLMRYYRDGRVKEKAFLDDYAFMILGLLDLYEATFDSKWLVEAKKLAQEVIELFSDSEEGGFFLTGRDGEKLIASDKPSSDGAIPSGNSVAALVLLKLGRLTMNQAFTERGTKVLEAFSQQLEQAPAYSSAMLTALNFQTGPTQEIVIAGDADATDTKQMLELIHSKFLPNAVVLLHEQGDKGAAIEKIVPFVKNQTAIEGKATAYVCENYVCKNPVNSLSELEGLLIETTHNSKGGN